MTLRPHQLLKLWAISQLPGRRPLCVSLSRYWQLFRRVGPFGCVLSNGALFLFINSSSIWIHLLLMVAHLHFPCPAAQPCLNKNDPCSFHLGTPCAICWVKHTGPLLKCHDAVCLECDKSQQPVTPAVLWHYSRPWGTLLMLTNIVEWGSFTTHPLNGCQYSTRSRSISHFLQGHFCLSFSYFKCQHWQIIQTTHS